MVEDLGVSRVPLDEPRETIMHMLCFADDGTLPDDMETLKDIACAANFLDYEECLDEACKRIAARLKGLSPREIRRVLGYVEDA